MAINKPTNLVLASFGGLSACFSLILLFSTTAFAACWATAICPNGTSVECECHGQGMCNSTETTVTCTCGSQSPSTKACKGDLELE